jgi:NitT/TauT family transport system ATP-binding protein
MDIHLERIQKTFPGGRTLFRGLSLTIETGQVTCLVGPSGCGKSSLLRLIAGLDQPTEGRIHRPEGPIGVVFQEARLLPWRTVRENLRLPLEISGRAASDEELARRLALVRLQRQTLDLFPHQLSGGMKMRVALARALLIEPSLLLMDEPLAALDESTRQILQEEISTLHEAKPRTTVFVTHSLSEALFLADRILILGKNGELLRDLKITLPRPRNSDLRSQGPFIEKQKELSHEFRQVLAGEGRAR